MNLLQRGQSDLGIEEMTLSPFSAILFFRYLGCDCRLHRWKLEQCPAHPVLAPQALAISGQVFTLLYSDSFRGKKKGRMREEREKLERKTAREGEEEQRGRESRSRRAIGRGRERKNRSVRALHAFQSPCDLAPIQIGPVIKQVIRYPSSDTLKMGMPSIYLEVTCKDRLVTFSLPKLAVLHMPGDTPDKHFGPNLRA